MTQLPKNLDETLPPPGFDPDATLPPPGVGAGDASPEFGLSPDGKRPFNQQDIDAINTAPPPPPPPIERPVVANAKLTDQLAKLEAAEEAKPGDIPGVQNRLERLDDARRMLSNGTAQDLEVASQLDQNLRTLGVSEFNSMAHSSLFYQRGKDYVSGFGPKMTQAQIVAEGVLEMGQRPVSLAEFASTTGVSPTAARAAVIAAAERSQIPYGGGDMVPIGIRD